MVQPALLASADGAARRPSRASESGAGQTADVVAEMFKLLGDPTRCRILYALLADPDLPVSAIVSRTCTSRTTVSAALRLLRTAGAVVARRDGREVHYRVADDHVAELLTVRAVGLGRSVLRVLGQHTPEGVDPEAVEADLAAVPGVIEVHDLHLWALTSGMNVATAHLVSAPDADHHAVLDAATRVLSSAHHIDHATLQVEPADHTSCREISW